MQTESTSPPQCGSGGKYGSVPDWLLCSCSLTLILILSVSLTLRLNLFCV